MLTDIRRQLGCAILIIEHDIPLISSVADRLIALDLGAVVATGPPDAVLTDPRVVDAYLGGSDEPPQRQGRRRSASRFQPTPAAVGRP